jgi:hypothetical protein
MSSLKEHDEFGAATGAVVAILHAALSQRDLSFWDFVAAGLGGAVRGQVGSRIPDGLEPPTSSWHRSTAHSVAASGAVAYAGVRSVAPLAARMHANAKSAQDQLSRLLARFAAGAVVGTPAGYISHTLADAHTARGIPLLTKGF